MMATKPTLFKLMEPNLNRAGPQFNASWIHGLHVTLSVDEETQ